ncbi:UNVERIFIED_CONTAM: hypothetical protein FKN15_012423 [Acipenser sinensis]
MEQHQSGSGAGAEAAGVSLELEQEVSVSPGASLELNHWSHSGAGANKPGALPTLLHTMSSEKEKESPAELTERCFQELLGHAAYGNINNAVKPVLIRSPSPLQSSEKEKESPAELTERCFQELLGHAAYGNINNAVKPVLMYMDNHSLWEGKVSAVRCFKTIMYSIQSKHSHLVIQQLLGHLDANSKNAATARAGIVEVLSEAAVIVASGSGTVSNKNKQPVTSPGVTCQQLPTYQRSEVMLFIMGKIPLPEGHPALGSAKSGFEESRMIQVMLLKSLLQDTS